MFLRSLHDKNTDNENSRLLQELVLLGVERGLIEVVTVQESQHYLRFIGAIRHHAQLHDGLLVEF